MWRRKTSFPSRVDCGEREIGHNRAMRTKNSLLQTLVVALPLAALCGCLGFDFPGGACTAEFVYGLNVVVNDGEDPICDAEVTIEEGDYTETLESFECGSFVGAGERAGTYRITVEAEGYLTEVVEDFVITDDECHVEPRSLDITLDPA